MKQLIALSTLTVLIILMSCKQHSTDVAIKNDSVMHHELKMDTPVANNSGEENAMGTFYLVEVANGYNYDSLYEIASIAAHILNSKLDMGEKIYKHNKGIVLPDTSADELYRGEYYPRRPFGNQNYVSIEMSNAYEENLNDTLQMKVIANIFHTQTSADSVTQLLRKQFANARTLKRDLYLGCMH